MKGFWKRFVHWRGWKWLFPLPLWAGFFLFLACGAGLFWVFWKGLELWWPSYFLYGISAYALTALCIRLPKAVRMERRWMEHHPKVSGVLRDEALQFSVGLYREQLVNFGYGIYMIRRANREIKTIQENHDGESIL